MKRVIPWLLLLSAFVAGCETCTTCDNEPPAVPTGVRTLTGDGYVIVEWNPVYEEDLAGYGVYRSLEDPGPYHRIADVDRCEETRFWDDTVVNGVTYYYAVDAYDYDGNESDLSYETVDDTPRPHGWDLQIFASQVRPDESAIGIWPDRYDTIVLTSYDHRLAQYVFELDREDVLRIVPVDGHQIQDYGYTYDEYEIDEAPLDGWSTSSMGVEAILGHTYVLRTQQGYYGKLRIESMGPDWVSVYWAFQGVRWSRELAPTRTGTKVHRG